MEKYATNIRRQKIWIISGWGLSNGKNAIEIFFLHYHSEQEAKEKWERRMQRINWNKLLIKFNDQKWCTQTEVDEFMKLPYKNKLFLTCKHWEDAKRVLIYDYTATVAS